MLTSLQPSNSRQSSAQQVDRLLLKELYAQIPLHSIAFGVMIGLNLFALHQVIPAYTLYAWTAAQSFCLFVIMLPLHYFHKHHFDSYPTSFWLRLIQVAALLCACSVGVFPFILFQYLDPLWIVMISLIFAYGGPANLVFFLGNLSVWLIISLTLLIPSVGYMFFKWDFDPFLGKSFAIWLSLYLLYLITGARAVHKTKRQNMILQIELDRASQAKSRFMAAANHDLRQPMHAMGLHLSALSRALNNDAQKSLLANLRAATDNLNELFDALYDISRIEAGKIEVNPQRFSLQEIFSKLQTELGPVAAEKNLILRIHPSKYFIDTDPVLFERILRNLLANAITHTRHGKVLVGCRQRPNNQLEIQVLDTGKGIPQQELRNIFREFYRAPNSESDGSKNLGLGLSIVERFCDILNLKLRVQSQLDRGSCFGVLIPKASPPNNNKPALETPSNTPLYGTTVAIIDDDPSILTGMHSLVTTWGCRCIAGHNLQEVFEALEAQTLRPELVISDYRLADQHSGLDALLRIRQVYGVDIPAIIVTGDTTLKKSLLNQQYACELLYKPLKPAQLRAAVTHLLLDR